MFVVYYGLHLYAAAAAAAKAAVGEALQYMSRVHTHACNGRVCVSIDAQTVSRREADNRLETFAM